ncbi:MAG: FAD-binding protein [Bacteroidaceae bacterium]|nr:FAD-binding protein [Bacteroidaceae bacterium]
MIKEYQIRVEPKMASSEQGILRFLSRSEGLSCDEVKGVRVLKRSIDARQRKIFVNLSVRVFINELPPEKEYEETEYHQVDDAPQAIVVGAGPGGLFAALRLIELGIRPIVVERGKDVHERRKDIAIISREHKVDSESNYSFGEGGAGAFSDGKLFTRSKKRGNSEKILNVMCQHGASPSILTDAHPHIGTDKLPKVIENIRNTILRCGGEVHFQTRMDAVLVHDGKVVGIQTNKGETFKGPVILATGHSARDVYRWLWKNGVDLECKGIAMGVRLEHPSLLIDRLQYHNPIGRGEYLPAAEYNMVTQSQGRGVYSFCMCPGGIVVPAASGAHQVVVNGMSASTRNSQWSNSGMVVEIRPEDLQDTSLVSRQTIDAINDRLSVIRQQWDATSPLAMMYLQEELEYTCWIEGGMRQTAPAQRMADFVEGLSSADLPPTSYTPGVVSSRIDTWMPPFMVNRLQDGFTTFGNNKKGFLTNEASIIAIETRTSAPVRIPRDKERLQHICIQGLFPCGEGAGYAGGIVSAAVDGERCAEALTDYLKGKYL